MSDHCTCIQLKVDKTTLLFIYSQILHEKNVKIFLSQKNGLFLLLWIKRLYCMVRFKIKKMKNNIFPKSFSALKCSGLLHLLLRFLCRMFTKTILKFDFCIPLSSIFYFLCSLLSSFAINPAYTTLHIIIFNLCF